MSTKYETRYRVLVNFAINSCSYLCADVILRCYTVLTSLKKGETAVHGCNPTLSVSVVLLSRKINFFTWYISLVVLFVFPLESMLDFRRFVLLDEQIDGQI